MSDARSTTGVQGLDGWLRRGRGWVRRVNERVAPRRLLQGPEWVVLGVNTVCNLHCRMCDVGTGADSTFQFHLTGAEPRDMPRELLFRVLGETHGAWPRAQVGFAFTEPLLYPHLVDGVGEATRLGLGTAVTTNGVRLKRVGRALADAGLSRLDLSLDGPAEVHDSIRGLDGASALAMKGLDEVLSAEVPPQVFVHCTLTPWNVGHLQRFLEDLSPLPLAGVGFMHPNYTDDTMVSRQHAAWPRWPATPSNLEEMDLLDVDLDALFAEIQAIRGRSWPWPIRFMPEIHGETMLERFYRDPETAFSRRCRDAFRSLLVKADGTVTPAHGRCYRVEAGSLDDHTLVELWNAPALQDFRADLDAAGGLMPACTRCCSAM